MSSKKKQRVNLEGLDFPPPMSTNYLQRTLMKPWRRTDLLSCTESQIPSNQIWTQTHQQMFELQVIAKEKDNTNVKKQLFSSPYPQ